MSVTLRPVTTEDEPFLMRVYGSTRLDELALTGWDESQRDAFVNAQFSAQLRHYRGTFPEAEHHVIVADDRPVGRLYIGRLDGEIRILDITVLPEHRNAGIGTAILREIVNESENTGIPIHIYVESFNPSLRLFERLGFRRADISGIHFLLEWSADYADSAEK
jgi:ribosomal protein S18 acetylase RimI-like enzyme